MARVLTSDHLPTPPANLAYEKVQLRFVQICPGDGSRGLVPYYHFRIIVGSNVDVGHINFRVGNTEHVQQSAGHIGYEIAEKFRGHGFAGQACRALAPFARLFYPEVTITCDPDNHASRRTIEALGASYLDEIPVAPSDPHYERGSRTKQRYRWLL
jgi:predicted acetyltransferase